MKVRSARVRALLFVLGAALPVSAGSITTVFNTNNSGGADDSQMFDISVLNPSGITITSVDVNTAIGESTGNAFTLDIYTTPTTSLGKDATPGAWTLVSTGSGVNGATNTPTPVTITSFFLASGTYGIAFVVPTVNMGYTDANGTEVFSNADVSLNNFISTVSAPFNGVTNQRIWNGTINYTTGSAVTPEPGSLVLIGTALLAFGASRIRRRRP